MPEARVPWRRLMLLALVVLALHLWFLGAGPRLVQPMSRAMPWTARTIAEQPPSPPVAVVPVAEPVAAPAPLAQPPKTAQPTPAANAKVPETATAAPPPVPAPAPSAPIAQPQTYVLPPAARVHYKLTAQSRGITLSGTGELFWKHDGQTYEATLNARLLSNRTQTSTGAVTAEGLAPKRFSDKSRNEEATHFERDTGKVVFSSNRPEAPLQQGAQDRLSVLLQLGAMIAGAPQKYTPGTSISIQTASTRDAEQWIFAIDGMQTLELPGGTVEAIKLTRQPRREYDVKVELWLAPGMAYVPVRLRLTQPNGDWVDQQWSSTDRG